MYFTKAVVALSVFCVLLVILSLTVFCFRCVSRAGWSLLPDGLTPFGPLPLVPLRSPLENRFASREGDRSYFRRPFLFTAAL